MANSRKLNGALPCLCLVLVPLGLAAPLDAKPVFTLLPDSTEVFAINDNGVVTGLKADVIAGFVRTPDGTITTFRVADGGYTWPRSINNSGVITGYYFGNQTVGFIRDANGTITTFQAPKAGTEQYQGTTPIAINAQGVIAGSYVDQTSNQHGFVRAVDGSVTSIDVAGAVQTTVTGLNDAGEVVGYWVDTIVHGFVRSANGKITSFDAPSGNLGSMNAINIKGVVTGTYTDQAHVTHGYMRKTDGTFTTFDIASGPMVFSAAINAKGTVVGAGGYTRIGFAGFVRSSKGTIKVINAPKSQDNDPYGINKDGVVAGSVLSSAGKHSTKWNGFIWTP